MHDAPRSRFSRVTPAHLERLRALVGAEHVFADREAMEIYSHDETEDLQFWPEVVVRPANVAEVAAVLKLCHDDRLPVTPRGAGTGLSGGALAVHGGVMLSIGRLNRILEIDEENLMATVEPGVITQVLQETVEKRGLYYPPDPSSRGSCFIGGNVAHNAGGPRALKYGVTKDFVYGLEAVLPTGEIIRTGGKLYKNVTGYNLTQLITGSEGTLAVVTKIILKLVPLPRFKRTLLAPFPDVRSAVRSVVRILHEKITPAAVEFMEQDAVRAAERKRGLTFPCSEHPALLLIEVDGMEEAVLDEQAGRIAEVCMAEGAPDLFPAETPDKQKFLWDMRRSIGEAVKSISTYKEEDTVVPRSRLPELMEAIQAVESKWGIDAICYGHAGDGNIHVNILKRDMSDERWNRVLPDAIRDLFTRVVALGGSISGEHGVGYVQKEYLPIALGPVERGLMRRIKAEFDPHGILNPGKLFPEAPADAAPTNPAAPTGAPRASD